jgi:hypothetical protein
MAPRKTRQKIKDHLDSAVNHFEGAVGQLRVAMEMGEERSPECFYMIPKVIETQLALKELVEKIKTDI